MDMDFATSCPLVRPALPHIRFLFVGSRFCSTLPSVGPSRFRPCASLVLHLHQVAQGTFTPRLLDMPSTQGRQDADAVDRAGLRRKLLKAQAEAGDIVLLFGDESEALTHPYLAHAWAKKGTDLRIPAPGQAAKVAMLGLLDWAPRVLMVRTSRSKR